MEWQTTVRALGPKLLRYFCASFAYPVASELVQETFLRLVEKVEGGFYAEDKGPVEAYAFGIAHFVRMEAFKKLPMEFATDAEVLSKIESRFDVSDEVIALRKAVGLLEEAERSVLLLLINRDLSLETIGEILEIPVGTVKSRLDRAKRNLHVILSK